MTRLPVVSGKQLVAAFRKFGYEVDRQKGSHVVMRQKTAPHRRLTIPMHNEIAKGTLRSLMRESDINLEELIKAL